MYKYDDKYNRIYTDCSKEKTKLLSHFQAEKRTLKSDFEKQLSEIQSKANAEQQQFKLEFDFTVSKYTEGIKDQKQERAYYQQQLSNHNNLNTELKHLSEELVSVKKIVVDLKDQVQQEEKIQSKSETVIKNRDDENINSKEREDEPVRFYTLVDSEREKELD